jgi:DNA-binding response OmpR family regulator
MELSDLSVLYITDNQSSKEDVSEVLYKSVNKVFFSQTIEDAKKQYLKYSPCLIIVDSIFKDKSIINFLSDLRKDDIKTAFIVLTNNQENQYLSDLMELYITKYIIKPFTNESLITALNKCMEIIERRIYSNIKLSKGIFFNFQTQSIIKDDISYVLNKKESLLINLLIQNQEKIITYEELEYHIWDNDCTNAALKSLIRDFRKKTFKDIIKNYSGIGYKLNLE